MRTCKGPCGRSLPDEKFYGTRKICMACVSKLARDAARERRLVSTPSVMPPVAAADPDQPNDTPVEQLPPGHFVWGVSSKVDAQGNIREQWIKTRVEEQDQIARAMDAMRSIGDAWPARSKATPAPKNCNEDLLTVYPVGDPHIGMLAWPAETGNAFDLDIAERNLYAAIDRLVKLAPRSKHGLVLPLGDTFHMDNAQNTTTRGTKVDVDGRLPKVFSAGVRVFRRFIDRALTKHEIVDVIVEIGNHDALLSLMLAICLAQFYENNPRVRVNTSPDVYHWYRFGKVLIGTTHGDKCKREDLPLIMANDRSQDWAECPHRYWYIGHVHHDTLKELRGCTVESFRTLAGKDAWHHASGYRSGRDMKCIIHHKEHGEVNRHTVGLSQLFEEE